MQKRKISNGEGLILTVLVLSTNCYAVLFGEGAGSGIWISHIAAVILQVLSAFAISAFCDRFKKESFAAALEQGFGKVWGRICGAVFCLLVLSSAVVSASIFNRFIQLTALPKTPQVIIPLALMVMAAMSVSKGEGGIVGTSRLLFWFFVLVFFVFLIFPINEFDVREFLPPFDIEAISQGTAEVFLNRFVSILALACIYTKMGDLKRRRAFFVGGVLASSVLCGIVAVLCISVLGVYGAGQDFYPVFTAMSIGGVGGFVRHTEILASVANIFCLFFKISVCLLFADEFIRESIKAKSSVILPIALILASLVELSARGASSLYGRTQLGYASGFVVIIEILFVICFGLRARKRNHL